MRLPRGGQMTFHAGNWRETVDSSLANLERRAIVERVWRGDHTVWKPDPAEISDRLGWLTVMDEMRGAVPELETFSRQVSAEGCRHVVLLGMGGSSLGPEMLRQVFGSAPGCPELIVLDSTIPARVRSVTEAIDPARTMFLVSSKSGSTIEPNMLYRHFRALAEEAVGGERAGRNFIAVTDAGSPLDTLTEADGFRRVFLNPPDIGGRYSILSYFGLVPAALMGMDLGAVLNRAADMRGAVASGIPAAQNPGAWLGAIIASLALAGRDKLTLAASPSIQSFGLWAEQLLAESAGKEGRGIIPISGEPIEAPERYGNDRLFVRLRLDNDDNAASDTAITAVRQSGQPVVVIDMKDKHDIIAQVYCWEFAVAIAGAVLGIHPFDQPDVQSAKDVTDRVLADFEASGQLPTMADSGSLAELLAQAAAGDYLAIMAYVEETAAVNDALTDLRREVMRRCGIATTVGYGPRFLHSTGQLHKGGPASALLLQLASRRRPDVSIPGRNFSFGVLADAQALGDFAALSSAGLRTARVCLDDEAAAGIRDLARQVRQHERG